MRVFIAKIFCLLTIFFLSGSYVYSAVNGIDQAKESLRNEKFINKSLSFEEDENEETKFDFFSESDDLEEFEFLSTENDSLLNIHWVFTRGNSLLARGSIDDESDILHIPRWLWVRHIII